MALRNIRKMQGPNDGTRTLFESVMSPEVIKALKDWTKAGAPGILIGGVALSFYAKSRYTQDVDFLFLDSSDLPHAVPGFKKHRANTFEHKATGVEVELVSTANVETPAAVIQRIIETAVVNDGIRVASPSGLVAGKLFRFSFQDKADIAALVDLGPIDLTGFALPQAMLDRYVGLLAEIETTAPHR